MLEIQNFKFKTESSRLIPVLEQQLNKTKSNQEGIRLYNKFLGFILKLLGYAVQIKAEQTVYYVNKKSVLGWMNAQSEPKAQPFFSYEQLEECLKQIKSRSKPVAVREPENQDTPVNQPRKPSKKNTRQPQQADQQVPATPMNATQAQKETPINKTERQGQTPGDLRKAKEGQDPEVIEVRKNLLNEMMKSEKEKKK